MTYPLDEIKQAAEMLHMCWQIGWNEANGGNLSWRLPSEILPKLREIQHKNPREIPLPKAHPKLAKEIFLVSGTGQYFRHAPAHPEQVMGIIQLSEKGDSYSILWGLINEGKATSEFPTHLAAHEVRMAVSNGAERVVLHCHPPAFISLSFILPLSSKALTRAIWTKMPECIVIIPDGIRVVPPLLPGSVKIADASAKELAHGRIISWTHHGIFVSEKTLDAAFGVIETIEKASDMHSRILSTGGERQTIPQVLLEELVSAFNINVNREFLDNSN